MQLDIVYIFIIMLIKVYSVSTNTLLLASLRNVLQSANGICCLSLTLWLMHLY